MKLSGLNMMYTMCSRVWYHDLRGTYLDKLPKEILHEAIIPRILIQIPVIRFRHDVYRIKCPICKCGGIKIRSPMIKCKNCFNTFYISTNNYCIGCTHKLITLY